MEARKLNNEACALITQGFHEDAIVQLHKALINLFYATTCSSLGNNTSISTRTGELTGVCCSRLQNSGRKDNQFHYYPDDAFDEGMTTFAHPMQICEVCTNGHCHKTATKAVIFFNLGIAHSRKGEELEAQEYFHKSFSIQQNRICSGADVEFNDKNQGHSIHDGPSLCAILHNIGHSLWRCGRHTDAVSSYERALDLLAYDHATERRHSFEISSTLNCIAVAKFYASDDVSVASVEEILSIFTNALALRLSASATGFDRETATIINNTGRVRFCRGEFSAALAVYKKAHSYRVATLGKNHVDVAASLFNMAQTKEYLGHIPEAIDLYKQYLSIILSHTSEGSKLVAEVLLVIGRLSYGIKDLEQAYVFLSRALAASKLVYGPNNHTVARIINMIGNVLCDQSKLDLALKAYRSGLVIERIIYPSLHKNISLTLMNIARIYRVQEKWNEALGAYMEAITITRRENDPKGTIKIILDISFIYEMKGDFSLAAKYLSKAIDFYRSQGDNHNLASTLNSLGLVQSKAMSLDLGLASFLEAIDILRSLGRANVHDFTSVCVNAADIYYRIGEKDKALDLYKETLCFEELKCRDGQDNAHLSHEDKALVCCHIGRLLVDREDFDEALYYLELSLKICLEYTSVIDHDCTCEILISLGDLYLKVGNREKALHVYAEATHVSLCKTNPPAAAAA